jgi:hypothetical protein
VGGALNLISSPEKERKKEKKMARGTDTFVNQRTGLTMPLVVY